MGPPVPLEDFPVITVRDLHKRFDHADALRGVSFDVRAGEIFVIMGPSGAGKSVLLKHLVGLLRPDAGEVYLWDQPIHRLDEDRVNDLRQRIGVVFQSAALFDSLNVRENVAFALRRHRRFDEPTVRKIVAEKLALVEMTGTEELMPAQLSGGMRKRVGIARALALDPQVIFYDEPTAGLDPVIARTVDGLIARLRDQLAVTSVVVTHDLDTAFGIGDRIALLWQGQVLVVGTPEAIARDDRPEVRGFLQHRLALNGQGASRAPREVPFVR